MSTWLPASIPLLLRAETCWTKNQSCADPINHKFYWHVEGFLIVSSKAFYSQFCDGLAYLLRSQQCKATKQRGKSPQSVFGQSSEGFGGCLGWF